MQLLFQNTVIQVLLVFFAVIGAACAYQSVSYHLTQPAAEKTETKAPAPTASEAGDISADMEAAPVAEVDDGPIDYAGTHIMPDGSVMTGAGITIPDAVILESGEIEMPDGTVLEPVADFRQ